MRKFASLFVAFALVAVSATAALAAEDTADAGTTVTVNAAITLSGVPATIDFGSGVPGDALTAPAFTANVETNNTAGYNLTVSATDMTHATSTDVIPATAMGFAVDAGASASFTAANTPMTLATSAARSADGGDNFSVEASLTVPFVDSGAYNGDATFVASTL